MSAAHHPVRGALSLAARLAALATPAVVLPALMLGGRRTTLANAAVTYAVVRMLSRDGRRA
ncbi:hypothetical protein N866_07095 [Actinotalea ferrariae CF5-4]|uniref:Uncharacterized protein n=1 Tax=Actinotalea ferrariae CF5-4 TaxID=948458 RepID=A0A021W016_9CELL|nr:hypothetical protein [Actinotalea ferrariae]EYR64667.1 hypothetical protein N866_07095 [Actinotalea ferrariae CF5-4]